VSYNAYDGCKCKRALEDPVHAHPNTATEAFTASSQDHRNRGARENFTELISEYQKPMKAAGYSLNR
jgi:hypothetical protein